MSAPLLNEPPAPSELVWLRCGPAFPGPPVTPWANWPPLLPPNIASRMNPGMPSSSPTTRAAAMICAFDGRLMVGIANEIAHLTA